MKYFAILLPVSQKGPIKVSEEAPTYNLFDKNFYLGAPEHGETTRTFLPCPAPEDFVLHGKTRSLSQLFYALQGKGFIDCH
jgi:hypothetical protein